MSGSAGELAIKADNWHLGPMSVAEIKRAVDELSPDDCMEVAAHLIRRARKNDVKWQEELALRLDRCLAGKGHSADELLEMHNRLLSQGT